MVSKNNPLTLKAPVLQRINPSMKLGLVLLYSLVATLLIDSRVLLLLFAPAIVATWLLGGVALISLCKRLFPFALLGAGYLWMNLLFHAQSGPTALQGGLQFGIGLTMRALCFGAFSLFFVMTTDSADFLLSLVMQLHLSPRLAYGILAAYNLLPQLSRELRQIRAAHRMRGLGSGAGLRGLFERWYRYSIPLLASAIRKADRAAIAMESRAFTGDRQRTYYRSVTVRRCDWVCGCLALLVLALVLSICWHLGWLHAWNGSFA